MEIQRIHKDKINPAPYNPRKDLKPSDPEYKKLEASLDKFDLVEPLVWNKRTGNLVGGHQRFKWLLSRGRFMVDVSVVDLDLEEEKVLNLVLNNPNAQGSWDNLKLRELLSELNQDAVYLAGFEDRHVANLLSSMDSFNPEEHWEGMPEFKQEDVSNNQIIVHFLNNVDRLAFGELIGQKITERTKFIWYPYQEHDGSPDLTYKDVRQ